MGLDYVPFGRADLVWIDEDQSTESMVGAFDGLVRPPLTFYAGWGGRRTAWLGGLGLARVSTVTWDGEGYRRLSATGARLEGDFQGYLRDRTAEGGEHRAVPWLGAGIFGVIPQARDSADAFSAEEQADADEGSRALKGRIGGVGGRVGAGAEVALVEGLSLGARYHVMMQRSSVGSEDSLTVSWLTWGEAALRVQMEF